MAFYVYTSTLKLQAKLCLEETGRMTYSQMCAPSRTLPIPNASTAYKRLASKEDSLTS